MKNQLLLRTCVLMSCLVCILGVSARDFDFVVNDICYNVTSSSTVEVTQNPAGNIGSVTIPATVNYNGRTYQVTAIGDNAFNQCTNMTSVTIGSNVATIGNYAFYACVGLKSVAIPNSVTTIGEMAFAECQGINNLTIGNSVTTIQLAAFENCHSLRRIVLPNSLTSLSARLFAGCNSLTSVTLGNSVTTIYASVFKDCSALTSMVLPASVTSLGNYVFQNCTSLASVTCMATTPPGITGSTFTSSHYSSATLTVPKDCSAAYQAANYWKNFRTIQALHYDFDVNGIYYRIKSGTTAEVTYRVNSLNSYSGNVVIPANVTYNGTTYSVTAIGDSAFHSSTGLTSVTIPETVTELGRYAFFGCTGMTRVNITDLEAWCNIKVKDNPYGNPVYFAKHLFLNGTEVTDLVVPDGVTQLGPFLFYNCEGLTSVIVSNSVTSIRWSCFNSCPNLTTITLGSGLTSIENHVFELLPALTSVTCLATTPPVIDSSTFDSDAYSNATLIVPKGCKSAYQADGNWSRFVNIVELSRDFEENGICYNITGENTVEVTYRTTNYNSYSGIVSIPATVTHDGVTYDVTAIGDHAFYQCTELKQVWMSNSQVVTIGEYAMSGCPALEYSGSYHTGEALSLPKNLVSIGNYAFHDSNIKYIWCGNIIPPPVIQQHTFDDEQYAKTHIEVGSELEISIYQAADYWRNFVHFDVDDMAGYSFKQDGIYYAITGDNTVSVATDNLIFGGSYKGDLVIPQTVTYSGNGMTYNVTGVGRHAFHYCDGYEEDSPNNLLSVTLPSSIDSIGYGAFNSDNLKVLICFATTPPVVEAYPYKTGREWNTEKGTDERADRATIYEKVTLYVPASAIDAYKAADDWKDFLNIEPIPYDFFVDGIYYRITSTNTVEVFYRDYRHACYSGDVVIPETVTHDGSTYPVTAIGNEAFMSSDGLTSVTIPNSVTGISYGAFLGCTGLTSVTLPSSLVGLGDCSFMNCTGLTSVTIPGNVYYVGSYAFYNCTGLTSVTIGSGVTSIGLYTFCDCHALTDITCLATTPPTIQSNTFTDEHYTGATLTVPASSLNTYTAANYWKNFMHIQAGGARGDVNGDNNVNITDVTALINYLLSHNAAGVNVQAADCNQDSNVNITDVTTLINYLLSHEW